MSTRKRVYSIQALSAGTSGVNVAKQAPLKVGDPIPNPSNVLDGTYSTFKVWGTAALTGTYNISPTGTPLFNTFVEIYWKASLSNGASHSVVIFGKTVPAELITSGSNFKIECLYNGATWDVNIFPDDAGNKIVGTARIADDAVTLDKMAVLGKGKVIYGDSAGNPASIELGSADGRMILGDTTNGVAAVDMSGDATIAKSGSLTIASNAVTTAKILDANVTTAKVAAAAITSTKLSAGARKETLTIPVSFASAARIANPLYFKVCFDCTVDAIHGTVLDPFVTDAGSIVVKDGSGAAMTAGQLDFGTGLVGGNIVSVTPTANNTLTAGQTIKLELAKTTASTGEVVLVFCLTRN